MLGLLPAGLRQSQVVVRDVELKDQMATREGGSE
jgi:hypothetical protein